MSLMPQPCVFYYYYIFQGGSFLYFPDVFSFLFITEVIELNAENPFLFARTI